MIEKLDEILLSDNVVNSFYNQYRGDFKIWLDDILPEVDACAKLNQDNPWHIYNCLDHILHSVEELNKQTTNLSDSDRRMLAYVMFYHDIGKPDCYIRRYSKLYGREIDSFFNHNKKSVEIADRTLSTFGFSPNEIDKMKTLIDKHDIFMYLTLNNDGNKYHKVLSEEVVNKEISELNEVGDGKCLFHYLTMVSRADNLAQNPKMTADSLKLLDVADEIAGNIDNLSNI